MKWRIRQALNAKCLDLYVQQIEAASSGETAETVIYLPMVDNGYYGWDVLLSDELMQTMLGGLRDMPVSEIGQENAKISENTQRTTSIFCIFLH